MKKFALICAALVCWTITLQAATDNAAHSGLPDWQSAGVLAFGPPGVLFVGDSQGAHIYALELGDQAPSDNREALNVPQIDTKIAALLGTATEGLHINDMAVNPVSQNTYFSVTRKGAEGDSHLLLVLNPNGEIAPLSPQKTRYTMTAVVNPVSTESQRRGRPLRGMAITDLAFADGKLYVAGLSNEEFSSALRVLPYPFQAEAKASSLEIYHAAHGRFETHAPIRTFLPYTLKEKPHLLAAYTCTPLVTFPMDQMTDGGHVKGKTVAELGGGNRPLDMITYESNGRAYILIANSNRTLMRLDPEDIAAMETGLTEPVKQAYATAGVGYLAIAQVGVQHIDNLNEAYIIGLQRAGDGALNLRSYAKRRF